MILERPPFRSMRALPFCFLALAALVHDAASAGEASLTPIPAIQGRGAVSPLVGRVVTARGVVVGDFQGPDQLNGFFIQDIPGDGVAATSDGVFIYAPEAVEVAEGDLVEATGTVEETFRQTQIGQITELRIIAAGATNGPLPVEPVRLLLPRTHHDQFEAYEGMLVVADQLLTVTENRNLDRFGELLLSAGGRLLQPTQIADPGPAAGKLVIANALNQLVLDDGSTLRSPAIIPYPNGGLSAANTLRLGDQVRGVTGVLSYGFGAYRLQPTRVPHWLQSNPRSAAPARVGGRLKIATFNLLNYFNGNGRGGGFPTPRGARSSLDLRRQEAKLVPALLALDADVIGVQEVENDGYGGDSAIAQLVGALNETLGATTYAFVDPGLPQLGTQPIAVGLIFRTDTVALMGRPAVLDAGAFAARGTAATDNRNRVPLAASFREIATGAVFTVAVNHFKSKGKSDLTDSHAPDADQGDGQGYWNDVRRRAAEDLIAWLAGDPTGSGDQDALIVGDLNAYAQEDPLAAFHAAGFVDLAAAYQPVAATYTNVYTGQAGSLDYVLASPSIRDQVTGATTWHINVDEPPVLDYRTQGKPRQSAERLYSGDGYRSSDHDPILVGLDLSTP